MKLNVTAICTLEQVREVAAGAGGRRAVGGLRVRRTHRRHRPRPDPADARGAGDLPAPPIARIELLWASPRELLNIVQAAEIGCDIITVTPDLLNKLELFGKDLAAFSLETVQMFHRDAEAAGYKL